MLKLYLNKLIKASAVLILLTAFFNQFNLAFATHNRAGEITYRHLSGHSYEVVLTTYTDTESLPADREEIEFVWGDGNADIVSRESQRNIGNNTFRNIYRTTHTYPGHGEYIIEFIDPNRILGINNMTNSVNQTFYVESKIIIDPTLGPNSSPQLTYDPIDFAKVGQAFKHNPGAFDKDGDSLHFSLIPPQKEPGADVDGYTIPDHSNSISIDPHTGKFFWDAPTQTGIYNIAILIQEFRGGRKIGYIIRDMQIFVTDVTNNPPIIQTITDTCMNAGYDDVLIFNIDVSDPDPGDRVTLRAEGTPFGYQTSPARLIPERPEGINELTAQVEWEIKCEHIRKRPHQIVLKAEDNVRNVPLVDKHSLFISVIGPEPLNPEAEAMGNGIELEWDLPLCGNVAGYRIYRRVDSSAWTPAHCEAGVPAQYGYSRVGSVVGVDNRSFMDDNNGRGLAPGVTYCYRITAMFRGENQKEVAEGYASMEICAELIKDIPVVTHVDIRNTDENNGSLMFAWSKPTDIDTNQYPGPYTYELFHSPNSFNLENPEPIATFSSSTFHELNDSIYIDSLINTVEGPHSYELHFFATVNNDDFYIGKTQTASSIFLSSSPEFEGVSLSWEKNVPWLNESFEIYRLNDITGEYDSIATVTEASFEDTGLTIGSYYCYYVRSIGSYSVPGFIDPIINHSQIICEQAIDTVPPCPPIIQASADCDRIATTLTWEFENDSCAAKVTSYNIYFNNNKGSTPLKVNTQSGFEPFEHFDNRSELQFSMAGCYAVSAVDSYGNESMLSNIVCVDNCPVYELPNVFTPDGDEHNDKFTPVKGWRFVESIDLVIRNRWGTIVFKTTDPAINWDGTDMQSGEPVAPGVYYYDCVINETYLDGKESRSVRGTVQVIY